MKCTADRINTAKKLKQQKQRAIQLEKLITGVPASVSPSLDPSFQTNFTSKDEFVFRPAKSRF
jgi:hypothetical protein